MFYSERIPPPLNMNKLDDDVVAEMRYIRKIDKRQGLHSLVVKKLCKYYNDYLSVNQVSFSKYLPVLIY